MGVNGCDLFKFAMIIHQVLSSAERNSPGCFAKADVVAAEDCAASALTEHGSTSISGFIHGKFRIHAVVHVGLRRRPYIGVIKPQLPEKGPFVGVISLVSTVFFGGG